MAQKMENGQEGKEEKVNNILNECSKMAKKEKMKQWIAS